VKPYILDACALIAYFAKENGADNVKNILWDAIDDENITIFMNKTNLLEVYYKTIKGTSGNSKCGTKFRST
jgi:PIN domain nuclease of toxin-antitoxin system